MKLVITEKPSVAISIAKVLECNNRQNGYIEGKDYIISWCVGHLIGLEQPSAYDERYLKWNYNDLPIIPKNWKYKENEVTKKQLSIIDKLIKRDDVTELVCATDAGREGELIFRLVYHFLNCKKPFKRLWISSMEDSAIKKGFTELKPSSQYDMLYEAALCRERADWLVGINATRLYSCLYGQKINCGRVMTPTLAMVCQREKDIKNFVIKPLYSIDLIFDSFKATSNKYENKNEVIVLEERLNQELKAVVKKADTKKRKENPPALYDLTTLQREANRLLGYSANDTLKYTQSLYEKKLVTYPRTDSRYITSDMKDKIPYLVQLAFMYLNIDLDTKKEITISNIINNDKVTDHHAIIPTEQIKNSIELSQQEQNILNMICNRLLTSVYPPFLYNETKIIVEACNTEFKARGITIIDNGWKCFAHEKQETEKQIELPSLSCNQVLTFTKVEIKEGQTTPPKSFTEDTLLKAMEVASANEMPEDVERKGIGTPATRAGIIEKLINIGFMERTGKGKSKNLIPTENGFKVIEIVDDKLKTPSLTAEWEERLLKIEHNTYDSSSFMEGIEKLVNQLISSHQKKENIVLEHKSTKEEIGLCPICHKPVYESDKNFYCSNKECKFALWKENNYFASFGKKINKSVAKKLLKTQKVKLKKCISKKTGKEFDATVTMKIEDGQIKYSMSFE